MTQPIAHKKSAQLDLWSFHKVVRWVLPLFLFTLASMVLVVVQKKDELHRLAWDDAAYLDLATVDVLQRTGGYMATPPELMPYADSVLWRMVVYLATTVIKDTMVAATLISFACCLGLLLVSIRVASRMLGYQPYIFAATCVLAVSPILLAASSAGGPLALAMLLVMLAIKDHLNGLSGRGLVLPISSAVYIGLAMLIQLEFVLLWLVFWLHAGMAAGFKWRKDITFGMVGVQGATGSIVCLLVLWPIIHKNLQLIKVPWPAAVGSALVIEPGAGGTAEWGRLLPEKILGAYSFFLDGTRLFGLSQLLFLLLGVVMLSYAGMLEKKQRVLLLPLFVLVLAPGLYGAMSLFTGPGGADIVLHALVPLFILTGVYGVFRLPFLLKPGRMAGPVVALLMVGAAVAQVGLFAKQDIKKRAEAHEWQERYRGLVDGLAPATTTCLTDRPGFPAFENKQGVIDLAGRACIAMLQCLDDRGQLDPEKVIDLIEARKPHLLILWDEENYVLASRLERKLDRSRLSDLTGPSGNPMVFKLNWAQ